MISSPQKSFLYYKTALTAVPFFFILYLVRFNIGPLPTNILELYIGFLALWYIIGVSFLHYPKPKLHLLIRKGLGGGRSPHWFAVSFFFLATTIATIATITNLEPEHILVPLGIWKGWIVAPILLYIMMISTFKKSDLQNLIEVFIGSLSIVAAISIVQFFTGIFPGPQSTYDLRLVWPYLDPWTGEGASANYPALFLSPALLLAVFANKGSNATDKIFYTLSAIVLAATVYLTRSFGAYLSLLAAISLITFLKIKSSKRWLIVPITVGALVILAATQWHTEKFQWFLKLGADPSTQIESSTSERINIYKVSTKMLQSSPLLGIGIGQYQSQFESTAPDILEREISRKEINHALHPHNTYLMFWLSGGILSLLAFLCLVATWMRSIPITWKFLLWAPMSYWLIHGVIDVFYWKNDLAFSFWFIGALMVIASQQEFKTIIGVVEHGIKKGTELGFPTANIKVDAPPGIDFGVHLVSLSISGLLYRGLLYFGHRSVPGLPPGVVCEVTLLDFEGDLYGQQLKLKIHQKLRGEMAFESEDALRSQIEKDVLAGKNLMIPQQ
jgi:O-antigen ligase